MNSFLENIKKLTLLFLLGGILDLSAQATKLVGNLTNPTDMVADGNVMYFADYGTGKISKFKLGIPNPVLTEVSSGFGGPFGMALHGNELYVAEYDSSQITKIDISKTNPAKQKVWQAQGISDLEFVGDTLFAVNFDFNRIEYAVVSQTNPSFKTYAKLTGPFRLLIKDSLIYANETSQGRISRINRDTISPSPKRFGQSFNNSAGMAELDQVLYIAENSSDLISKIDLTDPSKPKTTVLSNLDGPDVIIIHNKILYISEFDKGQISFLSLDPKASSSELYSEDSYAYPNPCSKALYFKGILEPTPVSISSMSGKIVKSKMLHPNEPLDVSRLNPGLYILFCEQRSPLLFKKL